MTTAALDVTAPAARRSEDRCATSRVEELSVIAARELIIGGRGVLVDVREFFEFTICPHVPGAWFLPGSKLKLFMGQPLSDEVAELASELSVDLDVPSAVRALRAYCAKAGIILCFCRSGRRSIDAASALAALGCTNAVSVSGGILAWEDAGFEIANGLPAVGAATQPGPRPASGARSIRIAPRSVGRKASIR